MSSPAYFAEFGCTQSFHIAVYIRITLVAIIGIALTILAHKKDGDGILKRILTWSIFSLTVLLTAYALWVSAPGQCLRQVHWHEFLKNSKNTI